MNHAKLQEVFRHILAERQRQDTLREQGRFRFTCADPEMGSISKALVLGEEYGEVCRALLSFHLLAYDTPEKGSSKHLQKELIQVAAVACAWLESMEDADPKACGLPSYEPTEGMPR